MNSVVGNCDSCDTQLWSDGRAGRHGEHGVYGTLCGPCHRDAETAELKREVDRLTQELAQTKANELAAISFAGQCRADLERAESKLAERTQERDDAHQNLAIVYGRNECGQRFPPHPMLVAAARRVASRAGWADPYPEEPTP